MDNIENKGEKLFEIFQIIKEDFFNNDDNELILKKIIDKDNTILNKSLKELMNKDDLSTILKELTNTENKENFIKEIKKEHNEFLTELFIELNKKQNDFFYQKLIELNNK